MATIEKDKDLSDLNLDALFRRNSKARVVAQRLLAGAPKTRAELVEGLDLSATTVPRVVEALESAGVVIERTTGKKTLQATYKVTNFAPVSASHDDALGTVVGRYSHASGQRLAVDITGLEIKAGAVWIEATVLGTNYRARVITGEQGVNIPPALLSNTAEILELVLLTSGDVGVILGDEKASALVSDYTRV